MDYSRLERLAVNDKGFVFDPNTGECFTVNITGKVILLGLVAKHDQKKIADDLVAEFEVTLSEAAADIRDFIHHLKHYQLC